jgi:hypothetical protein
MPQDTMIGKKKWPRLKPLTLPEAFTKGSSIGERADCDVRLNQIPYNSMRWSWDLHANGSAEVSLFRPFPWIAGHIPFAFWCAMAAQAIFPIEQW